MKILITALLITIPFSSFAFSNMATHHIPQTAEDHGPDLPTVGSSMF
jgi:hypothetical protein